jgi:hypothetical protein
MFLQELIKVFMKNPKRINAIIEAVKVVATGPTGCQCTQNRV